MMGTRERLKGDEEDRLHWKGWRRVLSFRRGAAATIKGGFWRRVRRERKVKLARETE